jgi:hypothetical protein
MEGRKRRDSRGTVTHYSLSKMFKTDDLLTYASIAYIYEYIYINYSNSCKASKQDY